MKMIEKKMWKDFQDTGLLWWINRTLHLFGWAIVLEIDELGVVENSYPARVKYRGFSRESEVEGFIKLTKYLKDEADSLIVDTKL